VSVRLPTFLTGHQGHGLDSWQLRSTTPEGQPAPIPRVNQDWLIKISYDYGDGDGHVIWRLGKDGDFTTRF